MKTGERKQEAEKLRRVWTELGGEKQAGLVKLMAQLVARQVMAQMEGAGKEASDVRIGE
jgi:hypothetical protein